MNIKSGKRLAELTYEVDVLRQALRTVLDDQASICWQDDGTLTYFGYDDGFPTAYFAEHTDFANNREDFTSLERFVAFLKRGCCQTDTYHLYLFNSPVWEAFHHSLSPSEDTERYDYWTEREKEMQYRTSLEVQKTPAKIIDLATRRVVQA